MLYPKTSWVALLVLAACGGGGHAQDDAAMPDAPSGPPQAFVAAGSAGGAGVLSRLDVTGKTATANVGPTGAVGADPVLRHVGHELWIVNRGVGGSLAIVDDTSLAMIEQFDLSALDPQDVAAFGNKLFIPTRLGHGVAVVTRGSQAVGIIDASLDDADGTPNCTSAYAANDEIYVACNLLNDETGVPRGNVRVYAIDPATQLIRTAVTLTTPGARGLFEQIPRTSPEAAGDLVIPTSGCAERVTPGATPKAAGCLFANTALETGSYATRLSFQIGDGATVAWVTAPVSATAGDLRAYDFTTHKVWEGALNAPAEVVVDAVACPSGDVIVADAAADTGGLRIYTNGAEATATPLAAGARPQSPHGMVCF